MSSFYTTERKLNLANGIVTNFCSSTAMLGRNNSDLKAIQKIEHKYNKSNGRSCDLDDFCIPLSAIPNAHYKLMTTINWLDNITEKPTKNQDGFYKFIGPYKPGISKVEYFMTIDKYIQILFIELNIRDLYSNLNFAQE